MSKEKLGIVIITWNSQNVITECLEAINKIKGYDINVVIVDNGSKDDTIKNIYKQNVDDNIKVISLTQNCGTTISRNIAIKELKNSDFICVLDSDTKINQAAIDRLISVLKEKKNNGIVGPKMLTSNGEVQNSGRKIPSLKIKLYKVIPIEKFRKKGEQLEYYLPKRHVGVNPVGYLMSACWMIKKELIDEIGVLDENIFYAPEDVEYCIRAWKSGYRVLYCDDVEIIHEWQRLSRKKVFSKHNWEHMKGLVYLFHKYHFWFNTDKIENMVK